MGPNADPCTLPSTSTAVPAATAALDAVGGRGAASGDTHHVCESCATSRAEHDREVQSLRRRAEEAERKLQETNAALHAITGQLQALQQDIGGSSPSAAVQGQCDAGTVHDPGPGPSGANTDASSGIPVRSVDDVAAVDGPEAGGGTNSDAEAQSTVDTAVCVAGPTAADSDPGATAIAMPAPPQAPPTTTQLPPPATSDSVTTLPPPSCNAASPPGSQQRQMEAECGTTPCSNVPFPFHSSVPVPCDQYHTFPSLNALD